MNTTSADVANEPMGKVRPHEVSVKRGIKKYIYILPSGRKLKIVIDDEREVLAGLFAVQAFPGT